jgi:hypothetical protein
MKKLNGLQRSYMRKLAPIEKAIYTFSLVGLEIKEQKGKEIIVKIINVCEKSKDKKDPLMDASDLLSLMLLKEDSVDAKSSILSAINVLGLIREKSQAESN